MAKPSGKKKESKVDAGTKTKTSIVIEDTLLQRLKHAALDERTDVSTLLSRLAADYLAKRSR